MVDCVEKTGRELNLNNENIVKYICSIEEERKNLELIIQKQYQERKKVEADIERLTYKLCLINKGLSMRIKAKNNYDKAVEEITNHYGKLVDSSNQLKQIVEKSQQDLDDIMNKKTGTVSNTPTEKIEDECPCIYNAQVPTKENVESSKKASIKTDEAETVKKDNSKIPQDSSEHTIATVTTKTTSYTHTTGPMSLNNESCDVATRSQKSANNSTAAASDSTVPETVSLILHNNNNNNGIKLRKESNVPSEIPSNGSSSQNKTKQTMYDLDKHRNNNRSSTGKFEDKTKNMLLTRIKESNVDAGYRGSSTVPDTLPRISKIVGTESDELGETFPSLGRKLSDVAPNKLLKRSIQDILTDSEHD